MDVPKGVPMKPPKVLFISLWRLLIFGIIKTTHYFQQRSLSSNFIKGEHLTPDHAPTGERHRKSIDLALSQNGKFK